MQHRMRAAVKPQRRRRRRALAVSYVVYPFEFVVQLAMRNCIPVSQSKLILKSPIRIVICMLIVCRLYVEATWCVEQCCSGEIMSTHHGEIIFNERNVIVQEIANQLSQLNLVPPVTLANTFAGNDSKYVAQKRYQDVSSKVLMDKLWLNLCIVCVNANVT